MAEVRDQEIVAEWTAQYPDRALTKFVNAHLGGVEGRNAARIANANYDVGRVAVALADAVAAGRIVDGGRDPQVGSFVQRARNLPSDATTPERNAELLVAHGRPRTTPRLSPSTAEAVQDGSPVSPTQQGQDTASDDLATEAQEPDGPAANGTGFLSDAVLRHAIERHAVDLASAAYESEGYVVRDTGEAHPYDLEVSADSEIRRVEVKGSSVMALSVELTKGEVKNARRFQPTDLYVVDNIVWAVGADGAVETSGGRVRHWRDWVPGDAQLSPSRYRYELPNEL